MLSSYIEAKGILGDYPKAKQFVICVFSTLVTTVKVESLFSVMNYNARCGLKDSTVAASAQVQLLQPQLTGIGEGAKTMQIDTEKALDHKLPPSARACKALVTTVVKTTTQHLF
jgi:hypothetical protein